jgi:hypothetical protein
VTTVRNRLKEDFPGQYLYLLLSGTCIPYQSGQSLIFCLKFFEVHSMNLNHTTSRVPAEGSELSRGFFYPSELKSSSPPGVAGVSLP